VLLYSFSSLFFSLFLARFTKVGSTKNKFVNESEYHKVPDDAAGKGVRYDTENTVIDLLVRKSAVQVGLTGHTHLFAECIAYNEMVKEVKKVGTIVRLKHGESFGVKFDDTSDIEGSLKKLGEKWLKLVESLGYTVEVLRGDCD